MRQSVNYSPLALPGCRVNARQVFRDFIDPVGHPFCIVFGHRSTD